MQEMVGVSRHPRISRVQLEVAWTLKSALAVGSDRGCMRSCQAEGGTEPVGRIPQRGRLEICLARLLLSSKFRLRAIGDPWRRVTEPRAKCLTRAASRSASLFRPRFLLGVAASNLGGLLVGTLGRATRRNHTPVIQSFSESRNPN
jgi:hypothetical protein